jgi:SAM-dependent methyltransferase
MARARYDGYADWYDTTFGYLSDPAGSAGTLSRLLGPPDAHDPVCLDIGCGTGLHFEAAQANGYTVIGVDLSSDQLRIAASRNRRVIQADAGRLPLAEATVSRIAMTFTHTDVDDFPAAVREAARVLRPGGRLVYLGLHPAYVGAFIEREAEVDRHEVLIAAGYGDENVQLDPTGRYPVRSRVGARNLTLGTFLGAFLAQPNLRLSSFDELDTGMRPWRAPASDGRVVPWNIALTAHRHR